MLKNKEISETGYETHDVLAA